MSTLYGNAADDSDWNNPNNWFVDAFNGTPAGHIPIDGDDVFVMGDFGTGPSLLVELNSFDNSAVVSGFGTDGCDYTQLFIIASLNFYNGTWVNTMPPGSSCFFGAVSNSGCTNLGGMDGSTNFMQSSGTMVNNGNLTGGSLNWAGDLFGSASLSQGSFISGIVVFDSNAFYSIFNSLGNLNPGGCVVGYPFAGVLLVPIGAGLIPDAGSVVPPATTVDDSGNVVEGTASSGGGGFIVPISSFI